MKAPGPATSQEINALEVSEVRYSYGKARAVDGKAEETFKHSVVADSGLVDVGVKRADRSDRDLDRLASQWMYCRWR